jgi:hypothetical protein
MTLAHRARILFASACFTGGAQALAAGPTAEEVRIHALAFGAILGSQNGEPHTQLALSSGESDLSDPQKERDMLASWWGVHTREELLSLLDKLQSGEDGTRSDFWVIRRKLIEGKMENYVRIISEAASEDNGAARAVIVATHLNPIHGNALPTTAWDFGRYINLCRWGVVSGWLTEQEAWDRIVPAARLLQASFTSWDEFAVDYIVGRNFWNPQSASENETIRYTVSLLEFPPKGVWSTIPWNESLGNGEALRDTLATKLLNHYQDPAPNGVSLDHLPDTNPLLIAIRTSIDPK